MFERFFGRRRSVNREIVDRLYGQIVAAARQPLLYSHWKVPDSPLGRFEMVALHLYLFLHRVRGETGPVTEVAQELTDEFFRDMEHSIRELGVTDVGVPKRMKRLARMFYGRARAYDAAIDADDVPALASAFRRNIRPGDDRWPEADDLASHVVDVATNLAGQSAEHMAGGMLAFPVPRSEDGIGAARGISGAGRTSQ